MAKQKPAASGGRLTEPGWNPKTRRALERLIDRGAGKNLPVVFDFDNTLVCGDVGEATLAVLIRDGIVKPAKLPATFSPPFRLPSNQHVTLEASMDAAAYYDAFLAPTIHGDADPTPLAKGYAWAVEVMQGLRVSDVTRATRIACAHAQPPHDGFIEVTPGKTRFPAPHFYPEMVELIAALLRNAFDVWIVSASNAWSVRWMVLNELNPRLRQHGCKRGLTADHVIGITTLLTDRRDALYKDNLLLKENPDYAKLDEEVLRSFRLTSRLHFPVSTYSGKIAAIFDHLGRPPYLCVGDSPGDLPMLAYSQHRLWIARVDKTGYQQRQAEAMRLTGGKNWLIQATRTKDIQGFLPAT